jgi:hypothetical protein
MDGQPGDKSPGYYRVSLRDECENRFSNVQTARPFGAQTASLNGYKPGLSYFGDFGPRIGRLGPKERR